MDRAAVLATIDHDRFAAIQQRWGVAPSGSERREKYLDLAVWIDKNLRRAQAAGLLDGPLKRVLDLGCGCGYFLHICRLAGHAVLGVDRAEKDSLFVAMRDLLEVPWIAHTITPSSPPPVGGTWDVVTAHMVCFNGHRTNAVWGPREWGQLMDAVSAREWHLELNAEPDGVVMTPELQAWFEARGAIIDRHHVRITSAGL